MKSQNFAKLSQDVFNTLAQSGTEIVADKYAIVQGAGSDIKDFKTRKNKAKRKFITQAMVLSLIDASKQKKVFELIKSYWNAFRCQTEIVTANRKIFTKYCKNRHCTICCAIRKADIINRYLPIIRNWEEPYFVTLTLKAVTWKDLKKVMISMNEEIMKIIETYRKKYQRGTGIKLIGIRSLECNFNPKKKWYNPHFHLIVANKEMATIFINEWHLRSKDKWVNKGAQKMIKVFNNLKILIEVVKYGSKIFTEPDVMKKKSGNSKIYALALNNIFIAMKGLRIFERFGFNLPFHKKETLAARIITEFEKWRYSSEYKDWFNEQGNQLTNYNPPPDLLNLLIDGIDIENE